MRRHGGSWSGWLSSRLPLRWRRRRSPSRSSRRSAGPTRSRDIGSPPGVPASLGGLTLKAGTTDRLLIGGAANGATRRALRDRPRARRLRSHHRLQRHGDAVRRRRLQRRRGHVRPRRRAVPRALAAERARADEAGQQDHRQDHPADAARGRVARSPRCSSFRPASPAPGSLKLASYSGGQWYDAGVVPDGGGTYNLANLTAVPGSTLDRRPRGLRLRADRLAPVQRPEPARLRVRGRPDRGLRGQRQRRTRSSPRAARSSPGSTAPRAR